MKAKKVLALVLCAALLVAGSVAATLAYLMSTDTVTNTFTIGNVTITLDETDVDVYGVQDGTTRVKENTYKLIPGHTYTKDPIIHVQGGSEACYVFVEVVDQIAAIQDTDTVAEQMIANGWTVLKGNVWYKATAVDARNVPETQFEDVAVFGSFKIKGDANVADFNGNTITVTAYAVQADGFADAVAAWNATYGKPANS